MFCIVLYYGSDMLTVAYLSFSLKTCNEYTPLRPSLCSNVAAYRGLQSWQRPNSNTACCWWLSMSLLAIYMGCMQKPPSGVSWALLRKGAVFLPSVANSCLHLRLQLPSWKDVFASQKAVMLEHKNGLDLKGLCFFKEEVFATNKIVPPLFHYPLSNIVPFHPFVVNAYI